MSRSFTSILGFLIIGFALAVQIAGYMNLDNAWLLHVAGRVVNGEQLGRQVIESNPPLIIYMMELPTAIAKLLQMDVKIMFNLFIGLICLISLLLTLTVLEDKPMQIPLIFALFFLPAISFGEREHIFIALVLPYFVSLWYAKKYPWWFILLSALMAGIGFALKPFFLLMWAAMVLVKMALDKKFWSFINFQNIIIGLVLVGYVAYLFFIEKIYIEEVFPLMVKYYSGFNGAITDLYKQSIELAILCQVAFWVVFIKDRKLLTRAMYFANFANLASILIIIAQNKIWLNYFYPPDFFGFVSNTLLTLVLFENLKPLWNKVAAFISSFILMVFLTLAISINMKVAFRVNEEDTQTMAEVFDKYASGKPVYDLSFNLGTIFPSLLYSKAEYHGRYGHLWSLPGMYNGAKLKDGEIVYHKPGQRLDDETRLIGQVISDMERYPPEVVVVLNSRYYSRNIGDYYFDFVKYFSQEEEFADIWKNYHKIKKIGDYDVYVLKH